MRIGVETDYLLLFFGVDDTLKQRLSDKIPSSKNESKSEKMRRRRDGGRKDETTESKREKKA